MLATKFPAGPRGRTDDLPGALEASLERLGRDRVDLYQHHYPSRRVDIARLMGLMADAVSAGKVTAVGVSNYSAAQMRLAHALWPTAASPWRPTRCSTRSCTVTPRPTASSTPVASWASPWSPTSRSPAAR